jgi:hypothetical protein
MLSTIDQAKPEIAPVAIFESSRSTTALLPIMGA